MCRGFWRRLRARCGSRVLPDTESPLARLASASGRDFANLFTARRRTAAGLEGRREALEQLGHDQDASVVLMGSWGRHEVTSGSDDDFMLLVNGSERPVTAPSIEDIRNVLDRPPSPGGPFGEPVFADKLVENIGLDEDHNKNLTRRMLFLLEGVPLTAVPVFHTARDRVLSRYLDESVKHYRPPRFLLNDVVRYWRTMCVDFAGKEHEGPEKWGIRNAKLRTSRKVLFAGGLLPVLECVRFDADEMPAFLRAQFATPPTDRIAASFLEHGAVDAGGRTLGAYDEFVGMLNDDSFRSELQDLSRAGADTSDAFASVRRVGRELQAGLLALLFETEPLREIVRDYALF